MLWSNRKFFWRPRLLTSAAPKGATFSPRSPRKSVERYHYLGAMLGGSPHLLRYVFGVEDRLLGVIGFGPAALKVQARDSFLGWQSSEVRRQRLPIPIPKPQRGLPGL